MLKLYDFELSGHAHRVRLMLSLIEQPYEKISLDLASGEHKQDPYISLNPFGLVPVLNDDGYVLRDSIAIIVYLATKYAPEWYPEDPKVRGRIHEWLALGARELAEGPARARLITVFGAAFEPESTIQSSHELLKKVDGLIGERTWLAGGRPTVADVACYSYIAHAPEGNVSLENYHNINRWLESVESLSNFTPMQITAVGLQTETA